MYEYQIDSSGLTIWSLVVTLQTIRFNIKKFCILPRVTVCFSPGRKTDSDYIPVRQSARLSVGWTNLHENWYFIFVENLMRKFEFY
jgi:hypothetical protein